MLARRWCAPHGARSHALDRSPDHAWHEIVAARWCDAAIVLDAWKLQGWLQAVRLLRRTEGCSLLSSEMAPQLSGLSARLSRSYTHAPRGRAGHKKKVTFRGAENTSLDTL